MASYLQFTGAVPALQRVVACVDRNRTAMETRSVPAPGPGEMLLRMRLSGLCGTDLFKLETGTATPGMVLGHEIVGEVVALGADPPRFALGDRVVVPHHVPCGSCVLCRRGSDTMCPEFRHNLLEPGGFAEYILVRERAAKAAARQIPDTLPDDAAIYLEPAACVLRGIRRSGVATEGLTVIQGAGGMGLLHLLVIKAVFPGVQVAVVDPIPARMELARSLGAVDASGPGDHALAMIARLSPEGADAVFDTVGGPRPLESAIQLVRKGGSVVLFAHAPEGALANFDLNHFFKHEKRVLGTYSGALCEQQQVFDLLIGRRLDPRPLNTHRLPLADFEQGVVLCRERRALKVLFENL